MQISDDDKKNFLKNHFTYEIYEIVSAKYFHKSISEKVKKGEAKYLQYVNMSIEHSCLHARNLYEFYFDKPDSSKLVAKDYNPNWTATKNTKNLENFAKRVNNEVSHLGFIRYIKPKDKEWDVVGLINEILELTNRFLVELDTKYEDAEIKKLKLFLEKLPP